MPTVLHPVRGCCVARNHSSTLSSTPTRSSARRLPVAYSQTLNPKPFVCLRACVRWCVCVCVRTFVSV
jgi:hypothetical protein